MTTLEIVIAIVLGILVGAWIVIYQPGAYRGRHRAPEQKKRR